MWRSLERLNEKTPSRWGCDSLNTGITKEVRELWSSVKTLLEAPQPLAIARSNKV